jgi:hypothetical protein
LNEVSIGDGLMAAFAKGTALGIVSESIGAGVDGLTSSAVEHSKRDSDVGE